MNRLIAILPASVAVLAAVACAPFTVETMGPPPSATIDVPAAATEPSPAPEVAPVAPDPSAVAADNSIELVQQSQPVIEGIGRWGKARGAGLPAQPDEFEALRAQTVRLEERARAIRQSTTDDPSISPHVRRAADANAQALNELVITVDLAQQIFDLAIKAHPTTSDLAQAKALSPLALDHLKHITSLLDISTAELKAYKADAA